MQLELPDALVACLRPPLEQLGFAIAPGRLETSFTKPLDYTLAKNGGTELTLLSLPAIFYGATNVVVLAANGLGFLFGTRVPPPPVGAGPRRCPAVPSDGDRRVERRGDSRALSPVDAARGDRGGQ